MRVSHILPLFLISLRAFAEAPPLVIAVQPLDLVKKERLDCMKKGLEKAYGLPVEILPVLPLPPEAWYAPRSRYRAEKILDFLNRKADAKYQIIVGITSRDISTTKDEHPDWDVFGLGQLGGRACVVSTFRLGARGADEDKLRSRLAKVAVHEVGHVLSLDHCPQAACVMQDAESSIVTVDKETGEFCNTCKAASLASLEQKR
jgi:archaemetzincin